MSLSLQNLNNIRTLRAMAREFSLDVLEEMLEKVKIVTEEKRNEMAEFEQQRAEQQDKINALLELMKADGISPADLLGSEAVIAGQPAKKRKTREAKYRFTDVNGEVKTWTGQGRTPKPIANALANGKSLEDFLI
ncbi:TPA: DNA-binding protein StpA [Enterobacter cancerogenus]|nr:DNA-binding protein StpA [Enterobacter asburiae]HDR2161332.1 DNA-binding protein StpA [Enterobacter cancerogenus]HDR2166288.1 DNA-binding protein StpA [Enterobacter cancerogenus]HDR2268869.1 DNA-binding protein StpA [Enterobacter cancerogenus]